MNSRLHLVRAYSIRSLIGLVVIALVLVGFYRYIAVENLKKQETNFNIAIARSLSAALWPFYAEFVRDARTLPVEALLDTPQFRAMDREITRRIRGLRIVKIKIYDTEGRVVYSTRRIQIGQHEADSPAVARALRGEPSSALMLRGRGTSPGDAGPIDRLSSWIPIRRDDDGPVEGGFEIFTDVTDLVRDIHRTGYTIAAGVSALLLALYVFLLSVVRRADRVIAAHERLDRQRQQSRIEHLVRYDALTGLPNRSHFMVLLADAIHHARTGDERLGMIYLAIDRFKLVNDSFGHDFGDRALVEFAARLRGLLGDEPIIARVGGDHFAIFDRSLGSERTAVAIAEFIVASGDEPLRVNGRDLVLTASLGLAFTTPEAEDAETLVENAITAMRRAKRAGRNGFSVFRADPRRRPLEQLDLEMDLRRALAANQFVLHYQPRVDTRTGHVSSLEALLRWQHPERGLLLPTSFVSVIEDMDLMTPIGVWVLEEACRQTRQWHEAGHRHLRVSVNVSLKQFLVGTLIDSVRAALAASGLPSRALELEITESVLADDMNAPRNIAHDLRRLGVQIAIDDFGTGYSSLGYLVHFPVDCLKIDRMFVTNLPDDAAQTALVRAISAMATELGLASVAEGVENRAQYRLLRDLGYTEVQGYWLGTPWAPDDVLEGMESIATRRLNAEPETDGPATGAPGEARPG